MCTRPVCASTTSPHPTPTHRTDLEVIPRAQGKHDHQQHQWVAHRGLIPTHTHTHTTHTNSTHIQGRKYTNTQIYKNTHRHTHTHIHTHTKGYKGGHRDASIRTRMDVYTRTLMHTSTDK